MKSRVIGVACAAFVGFALVIGSAGNAHAGAATDIAKAKQTTLRDLLAKNTPDANKKVRALIDELLDYSAMAEGSLGSEWAARTDAEKAEFSDLLKQLVRASYEKTARKVLGYKVEYVGEDATAGGTIVKTKATGAAPEEPVSIAFVLAQKGAAWKVQDIVTEDVSLVSSYRSQFVKIIKKDGFKVLVTKMKDKLAKGDL